MEASVSSGHHYVGSAPAPRHPVVPNSMISNGMWGRISFTQDRLEVGGRQPSSVNAFQQAAGGIRQLNHVRVLEKL